MTSENDWSQPVLRVMERSKKWKKKSIEQLLEPLTKEYFTNFVRCKSCGKVYWKGSHYEKMEQIVQSLCNTID